MYHVGFQVDLTEQPNAILEKLKDGSYIVNYPPQTMLQPLGELQSICMGSAKKNFIPPLVMSSHLKAILQTSSDSNSEKTEDGNLNHPLSLSLLRTYLTFSRRLTEGGIPLCGSCSAACTRVHCRGAHRKGSWRHMSCSGCCSADEGAEGELDVGHTIAWPERLEQVCRFRWETQDSRLTLPRAD